VHDTLVRVDVPLLERDPLAGSKAGGCCEDDHRPVAAAERSVDRVEFIPRLEGCCFLRRGVGLSTPTFAGLMSIIPHKTARWRTWRSARVASNRYPGESVIRHWAISFEVSSSIRRSPKMAIDLPSNQRSFSIVTGCARSPLGYGETRYTARRQEPASVELVHMAPSAIDAKAAERRASIVAGTQKGNEPPASHAASN
jgi:hypothetical protein